MADPATPRAGKATGAARVHAQLRADILNVAIRPGEALDESALAQRFGLSRSPVREALVRLSSEGLVRILPNRSIVAAPLDISAMPQFLDALDLMQRVVTRAAARLRSEAELEELHALARAYEAAAAISLQTADSLPMTEANTRFHMAIAAAGRNPHFTAFYGRLLDEGRRILHFHLGYMLQDPQISVARLAEGHDEMLEAIARRDEAAAEAAAHAHAMQFKGNFMAYLTQSVSEGVRLGGGMEG